jgi:hypothetical protein
MATLVPLGRSDGRTLAMPVQVRTLADVAPDADAAVIDAQGAELDVLLGADLDRLRLVVVETCTVDDPTMAARHADVDGLMTLRGFREVGRWVRDYGAVHRWARGTPAPEAGEIRDVAYWRQ